MVVKVTSPDKANNNNATIDVASLRHSIKDASTDDMAEKVAMITEYFACLNGKPDAWERFEPMLRRTVHPDVVVETNNGDMGYDDLAALVREKYIPNGCISELVSVHDTGDGTLTNTVNNHLPDEDGDITLQKVYFKDEKVIRVTSTVEFGVMLDRVSALETPSIVTDIDVFVARCHYVKVNRIVTVKNGKVVRSEPVASTDDDSFTKVYSSTFEKEIYHG